MLYKAFVRPLIEYCCSAWCPFYVKDVDVLERVQRRMRRLLPGLQHLSYEERLQYFHLTTLKTRRLRYDLICVYRMLKGLMNVDPSLFFKLSNRISRSHSLKLNVKFSVWTYAITSSRTELFLPGMTCQNRVLKHRV